MHVPEEIRAEAAALIDHHALGLWKPNDADRRAAVALFRYLETGRPLTGEQIRSVLDHAGPTSDASEDLLGLLRGTAGLLEDADVADGPAGRDAVDHVCLLLDALALARTTGEEGAAGR
ncbi:MULTISPECIES: hypothetical protein [unclassified Streptomyces]|uniref:hypothetical protein n=1 Tax=unclassified Streptomyces TaxID=2593676 RepID=UPI0037F8018D